ncbi:hypothetical protein N7340_08365 [Comamonas aquatica]|uniref:hypothetical protein n=1 Tax=Comamonas aquatica TaxID=225991 RepID=UPI002448D618|nr:hypothetical protein [Comamonas aquatica]MDH0371784.1 hypothetical protein [Comamonas aquatica]
MKTNDEIGASMEPLRKQAAQAVHQIAEPAAPVGKPIEDAIDALVWAAFTEGGCSEHRMSEARIQTELRKKELCTLIAATQPAAQGMEALTIVEKLPRYTYGYKSDEWGMNRCLRAYQDNAGTFLMRDEVLAALAAQAKQGGA